MDTSEVLELVKFKEGIKSNKRDDYLNHLIDSAVKELEDIKGIAIDLKNSTHVTFVADWAYFKYVNRDNPTMPQYLKQELHDLQISYLRKTKDGMGR